MNDATGNRPSFITTDGSEQIYLGGSSSPSAGVVMGATNENT